MVAFLARQNWKKIGIWAAVSVVAAAITCGLLYSYLFGPMQPRDTNTQYLISPDETLGQVAASLKQDGYIRSVLAFEIAYLTEAERGTKIRPGAYNLNKSMDVWTIAETISEPPALGWVTVPQGVRKEQVAEILTETLGWTDEQKAAWLAAAANSNMPEGVFYPDIYLIAAEQDPAQIVARFRARFTDQTAELAKEAAQKGLDWAEVVTLASIIEREAAKNDKHLVSGILWNRLNRNMLLQADATLQYAKAGEGNWWPVPKSEDKYIDSPYNTYKHVGLPPAPIATPSRSSIEAAINPQPTKCLYYLHDEDHVIHCSATYAGQVQNVNRYLK